MYILDGFYNVTSILPKDCFGLCGNWSHCGLHVLNFPDYIRFCSLHDNLRLVDQQREGRSNLYSLCIYAIKRPFVILKMVISSLELAC